MLPRPQPICDATRKLLRDRDEASLDEFIREHLVDKGTRDVKQASTHPQIEKAFAEEFKLSRSKPQDLLRKRFCERTVNGRDVFQYKGGTNYAKRAYPGIAAME